jgi:hypothetical protein
MKFILIAGIYFNVSYVIKLVPQDQFCLAYVDENGTIKAYLAEATCYEIIKEAREKY